MARLRLRLLTGPRAGQEFLCEGPRITIGRSRDNDIILPDGEYPKSSAHHAELRLEGGRWVAVDLGSKNGTQVNGATIDRRPVQRGDRIGCGDDVLLVVPTSSHHTAIIAAIVLASALVAFAGWSVGRRPHASSLQALGAAAARSVYLVALQDAASHRVAVGTSFAVSSDLLATNAHVAEAIEAGAVTRFSPAPTPVAIRSDSNTDVRAVVGVLQHPQWHHGSLKDDVALLRVTGGDPLVPLPLADDRDLEGLRRGMPVAAFGFPATATDPASPRGRLTADILGDVRGRYLEVGLGVAPGTSGSPVFDEEGEVIAIVVGGDFVDLPAGQGKTPSGSAANWAVSVTALRELLATAAASSRTSGLSRSPTAR